MRRAQRVRTSAGLDEAAARRSLIALLHLVLKFDPARALAWRAWVKPRAPFLCACCGAVMTIVRTRIRSLLAGPVSMPPDIKGAG